ncbi:ATPase associated with various cellular activities AAA_3 [Thermoproteus uzoniensis 768-20]|uniref:ATPase associated with various cellular activities AAA_3 n=1 Tax=Thermoproteus uzoniensis (strain 768-20) TaxID=999630 RepID=F2L5Q0_THEU7|nr:MoxR family ATPase [Thermoproteus uzoniensis]AEA13596.1 ATPase associated with various cellular activities AAA_3 [Thermoproteus uzoniensis 768-20]
MSLREAIDEISRYYVGDRSVVEKIMAALVAGGHVLIEDVPGVGKTLLAKLFSRVLGLSYRRIQFTPDLLPSDIIGTKVWRREREEFETIKGPIFTNVLLADEINRAPPKTQAALLEAMQELQVTIEGETYQLDKPFLVLATQNPIELEGTYPLPEAQLDRFMIRLSLGYPDDKKLLKERLAWRSDDPASLARTVLNKEAVLAAMSSVEDVEVVDELLEYIAQFAAIRNDRRVAAGPSPRALASLLKAARAYALIQGRKYVVPDDVKALAVDVLAHRIYLKPEYKLEGVDTRAVVREYLSKIPVPRWRR